MNERVHETRRQLLEAEQRTEMLRLETESYKTNDEQQRAKFESTLAELNEFKRINMDLSGELDVCDHI
jgi:hypothetical protein